MKITTTEYPFVVFFEEFEPHKAQQRCLKFFKHLRLRTTDTNTSTDFDPIL